MFGRITKVEIVNEANGTVPAKIEGPLLSSTEAVVEKIDLLTNQVELCLNYDQRSAEQLVPVAVTELLPVA